MTARKPPPTPSVLLPAAKPIPYPPAVIWKDKEEGVRFEHKGNIFARRGKFVARVLDTDPPESRGEPKKDSA